MIEHILTFLSALSNFLTIVASGIAIYVFIAKRQQISSAFRLLLGYSFQLTLSELKEKLERLNDFHAGDEEGRKRIEILLHETIGQLQGNQLLREKMSDLIDQGKALVEDKRRLNEPRKRAYVAELRERLRHIDVQNVDDMSGGNS